MVYNAIKQIKKKEFRRQKKKKLKKHFKFTKNYGIIKPTNKGLALIKRDPREESW